MHRTALLLAAALLLAGCAVDSPDRGGPKALGGRSAGTASGLLPNEVPSGCDANRTVEAHFADAVPAPSLFKSPIIPCVSKTGSISREPTIGISSKGTVFHYPAMTGDNTKPMGVSISKDGGATWTRVLPSLMGVPTHPTSVDPYFYLDPSTDRAFADDLATVNCSYFSWSDDEGATWSHSYSGCLETDHQTIFAGKPVTSQTRGYPNVVYRCAINAVALGGASTMSTCQRSLDGGLTWMPPGQPAFVSPPERGANICSGAHGHGFADAKGAIYLPKGHCGVPMLGISDDEGATWRRVQVATNGIQGHEAGVGVDPAGNIYYTWTATNRLPYLAFSRDAGRTWSPPIMIGAPDVIHAVFPELIVGGVGKIAWVYMGTRGPGDQGPQTYDAYLGVSYNALEPNATFYSAPVHDPVADAFRVGNCCGGIQDFIDVRIGPDGTPWGAFVDDCLGPGTQCREDPSEPLDTHREGAAGWFFGGPSLWDPDDPNGPYR